MATTVRSRFAQLTPSTSVQINVPATGQGRQPPPDEGSVVPGTGFVMPIGYIVQAAVKRSRPGSIDPEAAGAFAAWLDPIEEVGAGGVPELSSKQIEVIGYDALRRRAYPTAPTSLAIVSGNGQSAPISTQLPEPFVLSVADDEGLPVPGIVITFVVTDGNGEFETDVRASTPLQELAVHTDTAGFASATLTLGPSPGHNQVVAYLGPRGQATSVTFTATGTSGDPGIP